MENSQRSEIFHTETKRDVALRSKKWTAGAIAMLLSASLVLSACGDSSQPEVESTVAPPAAAPAADNTPTPEVSDSEAMTDTEGMEDTEAMTDTEGMTEGETMTDTEGIGDSEAMTDTEGMTTAKP